MWIKSGGVLAIANLRGGGEYGDNWHKEGMLNRMYCDYRSKAILHDNPVEMPRINFIFSDDEDNQ